MTCTDVGHLLRTVVVGHLSLSMAQAIADEYTRAIRSHRRVAIAHDWSAMTGYDPEARKLLTELTLQHHASLLGATHLVNDAIVNMGVISAGRAVRPTGLAVSATTERKTFEQQIADLMAHRAA